MRGGLFTIGDFVMWIDKQFFEQSSAVEESIY